LPCIIRLRAEKERETRESGGGTGETDREEGRGGLADRGEMQGRGKVVVRPNECRRERLDLVP